MTPQLLTPLRAAARDLPHGALRYAFGCRCISCTEQHQARRAEGFPPFSLSQMSAFLRIHRDHGGEW